MVQEFDLEGEYKLDTSRRIAKKVARIEHAREALEFDPALVLDLPQELELLKPFWEPGVTKEEAVALYIACHAAETGEAQEEDDNEQDNEWEERRAKLRRIDSNYRAAQHRALDDRLIEEMEAEEKQQTKNNNSA
jgi:hypothetical protein